jgi:energy-coupling factor transport system substrate-specific component
MKEKYFSTRDLILIALMAALGLAVKPLVKTFTHVISTPLGIPGGSLTGGLNMLWLTLPLAITRKSGAATLTGLLQGVAVLVTGWFGTHGALSILTYALPGVMADLVSLFYKRFDKVDGQALYCLLANLTGTWLVGWMIMRLPKTPFLIALTLSVISGIAGGVLSYLIHIELKKLRLTGV